MKTIAVPALDIDRRIAAIRGQAVRLDARQVLERRLVAALCAHMIERGWAVAGVWDGEEHSVVSDTKSAMELIFNLDEARLYFGKGGKKYNVYLVLGNGEDIISDWTYSERDEPGIEFNETMDAFMDSIEEAY